MMNIRSKKIRKNSVMVPIQPYKAKAKTVKQTSKVLGKINVIIMLTVHIWQGLRPMQIHFPLHNIQTPLTIIIPQIRRHHFPLDMIHNSLPIIQRSKPHLCPPVTTLNNLLMVVTPPVHHSQCKPIELVFRRMLSPRHFKEKFKSRFKTIKTDLREDQKTMMNPVCIPLSYPQLVLITIRTLI